eukprot:363178-Chlamydomonas_euryale.AAC.3
MRSCHGAVVQVWHTNQCEAVMALRCKCGTQTSVRLSWHCGASVAHKSLRGCHGAVVQVWHTNQCEAVMSFRRVVTHGSAAACLMLAGVLGYPAPFNAWLHATRAGAEGGASVPCLHVRLDCRDNPILDQHVCQKLPVVVYHCAALQSRARRCRVAKAHALYAGKAHVHHGSETHALLTAPL